MATMKDVARLAGVSLGTVSNVLNDRSSVLPENRERVMKAVEELGFRTNMVARSLKTKSSNDIALVIPDINNPFYPELARGVEDAANKAGFRVFLCNSDRSYAKERGYIDSLLTKNIDGMILVKPHLSKEELDRLNRDMSLILVDMGAGRNKAYNVLNVDDDGGFTMGMDLLFAHGHTRIAFISGMMESLSSKVRHDIFTGYMAEKGLPTRKEYIIRGDYTWNSGYKAAKVYMALQDPPTAIFAANDLMAIGCMKGLQEMGIDVPGDVSVLGYDNIDMAKLCTPGLTTVNQPKYELGRRSFEMLLRLIDARGEGTGAAEGAAGEQHILPAHTVIRESVADVKAPGADTAENQEGNTDV